MKSRTCFVFQSVPGLSHRLGKAAFFARLRFFGLWNVNKTEEWNETQSKQGDVGIQFFEKELKDGTNAQQEDVCQRKKIISFCLGLNSNAFSTSGR